MQLTRPNVQCSATLIPGLLANRSSTNTQHTVRLDNEYRPADVRGVGIYQAHDHFRDVAQMVARKPSGRLASPSLLPADGMSKSGRTYYQLPHAG